MKLLVKCRDARVRALYESHRHQYSDDSGFDVFCPDNKEIMYGVSTLLDLGIQCRLEDSSGNPQPYMLIPRSSIWKKKALLFLNNVGLIDKQYTGTIKAPVRYIEQVYSFTTFVLVYAVLVAITAISWNIEPFHSYYLLIIHKLLWGCVAEAKPCSINAGESLFQLVTFSGERVELELVDELPETERGERGFGSTTEEPKSPYNSEDEGKKSL